jgi:hypothetical protein
MDTSDFPKPPGCSRSHGFAAATPVLSTGLCQAPALALEAGHMKAVRQDAGFGSEAVALLQVSRARFRGA